MGAESREPEKKTLPLVYLACPYSHEDKKIELERFNIASKVAGDLMLQGYCVFSPISHSHPIQQVTEDPDRRMDSWDFWKAQDFAILEKCDCMFILSIEGWEHSVGVSDEIKFCENEKIPIEFIEVGVPLWITRAENGDSDYSGPAWLAAAADWRKASLG